MRFLVSFLLLCVGIVSGQLFGQTPINNNPLINNPLLMNNNPLMMNNGLPNNNNPLTNNPLASINTPLINNPLLLSSMNNNPLMMNGLPINRPLSGINQLLPINQGLMGMNAFNNPLSRPLPPAQTLFQIQQQQPILNRLPDDRIRELALQAAQPTLQQWSNNDFQSIFQRSGALNPLPNQSGGGGNPPRLIEGVQAIQSMPSTLTALQQQLQSPIGQDLLLTNPNLQQWMQQQQLLMQQALNNNNNNNINNNINRPPVNPVDQLQQAPMPLNNNNMNINNPNPIINAPSLQGLNNNINMNRPPIQDFTLMQPGPINNPPVNNINPQQPIMNNINPTINNPAPPMNININAPQPNINAPVPANGPRPRP